jgi:hypothetical protein
MTIASLCQFTPVLWQTDATLDTHLDPQNEAECNGYLANSKKRMVSIPCVADFAALKLRDMRNPGGLLTSQTTDGRVWEVCACGNLRSMTKATLSAAKTCRY